MRAPLVVTQLLIQRAPRNRTHPLVYRSLALYATFMLHEILYTSDVFYASGTTALYFFGYGVNGLWVIGLSLSNSTHNPLFGFSCMCSFTLRNYFKISIELACIRICMCRRNNDWSMIAYEIMKNETCPNFVTCVWIYMLGEVECVGSQYDIITHQMHDPTLKIELGNLIIW